MGEIHAFPVQASPGLITSPEDDLMKVLRCAIFRDSGLSRVPPGIWIQLSPENKRKVENWIEYEYNGGNTL